MHANLIKLKINPLKKQNTMEPKLIDAHVGHIIKDRLTELKMKKTEFGRLVGVPQQHVNRILERDTMETRKLLKVCEALDINIFEYFCDYGTSLSNISPRDVANFVRMKEENISLRAQLDTYKQLNELLKDQLEDKNEIIRLLKARKDD